MMLLKNRKSMFVEEHTITLIAEFTKNVQSIYLIAKLSDYVSKISQSAEILTDFQSHQLGYRITYTIKYQQKLFNKKNHYTRYLTKISDWLSGEKDSDICLHRYHYNLV